MRNSRTTVESVTEVKTHSISLLVRRKSDILFSEFFYNRWRRRRR